MRSRVLLALVLCVNAGLAPAACGAALAPDSGPPDAGFGDGFIPLNDASALTPHLVVVNALDQSLGVLNDTDVRVCLGAGPSDRPLPEDPSHPVPLSNYPGIPLGGGVDLGSYPAPTKIYVISAKLQNDNYPNGPAPITCDQILSTGASGKPYLTATVPFVSSSTQLVVLLDGTGDGGASAAAAKLDDVTHGPGDASGGTAYAQVGAFGPWARQQVLVDLVDPSDAATALASFDGAALSAPPALPLDIAPFADRALRFTSPGAVPDTFAASFQSIQAVSDPTTTSSVFYGQRANFLFLLLGASSGADAAPTFEDRGLHVVAVPYVP